jgi:uncharacterized membrane protein YphA (DoxX/SURF4 family)
MAIVNKIATTLPPSGFYLASGMAKVRGLEKSIEVRDSVGMDPMHWRLLGVAEVGLGAASLMGFANRQLELASKAGLMLLGLLAIRTHTRNDDRISLQIPAAVPSALSFGLLAVSSVPLKRGKD